MLTEVVFQHANSRCNSSKQHISLTATMAIAGATKAHSNSASTDNQQLNTHQGTQK